MDSKGYYKSLGVKENATVDEIKKAFKKLSLKYHPDRQNGKSDAEKKQAEEKFKEINEAYQVLTDENKKKNYDTYGDPEGRGFSGGFSGGFDTGDIFGHGGFGAGMQDLFEQMFGGGKKSNAKAGQRVPTKGGDVRMTIPLTIEEIFEGCTKKVKFKRNVRCANCHGEGGSGRTVCSHCHGTGYETRIQNTPFGQMRDSHPCPHCHGEGYTYAHKCQTCGGSGFKQEEITVEVTFPAGMPNGYAIEVNGKGHESKDVKGPNGTFLGIAEHVYDRNRYRIENLDVIEKVDIPYYDAMLGCEKIIELPNHSKKKINIPSCIPDGKQLRLMNEGIDAETRKGDYFLEIHYILPTSLDPEERKKLEDIKVMKYMQENPNTEE